jgi:hypothetical protein
MNVQRGTISIAAAAVSGNATISAVVMANSFVRHLSLSGLPQANDQGVRLELTSTTNVLATFGGTAPTGGTATIGFEVVEF